MLYLGKKQSFGLSNYPSWQVANIFKICEMKGYVRPSCYQGMYNGITRSVERELFSCLRYYNIRFLAYNPLAGGLLTHKYKDFQKSAQLEVPETGRFAWRPHYVQRFFFPSNFQAVNHLYENLAPKSERLKDDTQSQQWMTHIAFRWLFHSSELKAEKGDGVIIGFSTLDQLDQNLQVLPRAQDPPQLKEVFDEAWKITKADCAEYFKL